jgi:hypothetical protein
MPSRHQRLVICGQNRQLPHRLGQRTQQGIPLGADGTEVSPAKASQAGAYA